MKRILISLLACLILNSATAQEKTAAPEQIEFFEKKVRPVLVQHCYECHSATAKKVKAELLLDSRAGMVQGGDNGPAIMPGNPDKSRLIEAIRYTNVDLKMPKKGKLPDAVIADLTAWVKMGAPWPNDKQIKKNTYNDFNLQQRKKDHWCWQPIVAQKPPAVKDAAWARTDIDRFLLAKLEAKGIKPAPPADPRTLIRRLHLDIIGLPPTRAEVEDFVKAWDAAPQAAIEAVVDRLLASPHFGERWGRHWRDLVRYAESRGHEFDYTIPNAYHYRDYVIRAFNADVPYNQFVAEHIAGDLLKNPRLGRRAGSVSDRSEDTFNESILGTAFWFLGEECHSPVDIRQDQADRFDNRIDVMTKTFLGLTVGCARCHDHKFDAISTKDYYALFGILESSNYRLARFDTIAHNRKIAEQIWELRKKSRDPLHHAVGNAAVPVIADSHLYLLTAAGIEDHAKALDPQLLKRWQQALAKARKDDSSLLHAFALAAADRKRPIKDVLLPLVKKQGAGTLDLKGVDVIVDYRKPAASDWLPDDLTFGAGSVQPGDIVFGSGPTRPIARIVEQAAAERDRAWDGMKLAAGTQNESGSLGGAVRSGRTLRTPEFTLKEGRAFALVKGSGMIYAGVGQHIMLAGPLHGSLVQKFNTASKFQWVAINLMPYKGQRTHLEFTPSDNSDFAIIAVVQGVNPPSAVPQAGLKISDEFLAHKSLADLAQQQYSAHFSGIATILHAGFDDARVADQAEEVAPHVNWFVQNLDLFIVPDSAEEKALAKVAAPILEQHKKLLAQIKLDSRLTPAMQDGSGTDEHVFVRGNPKMLGPLVPRRFLEAFAGTDPLKVKAGSGRLELAQQMTDPSITPLITRVYVNRVWHHLFGRGIVGTVDNFGMLGEAPTHPELLDYLARGGGAGGGGGTRLVHEKTHPHPRLDARLSNVHAIRRDRRRSRSAEPARASHAAAPARRRDDPRFDPQGLGPPERDDVRTIGPHPPDAVPGRPRQTRERPARRRRPTQHLSFRAAQFPLVVPFGLRHAGAVLDRRQADVVQRPCPSADPDERPVRPPTNRSLGQARARGERQHRRPRARHVPRRVRPAADRRRAQDDLRLPWPRPRPPPLGRPGACVVQYEGVLFCELERFTSALHTDNDHETIRECRVA
ncbi:MAG: DUF1549 domain-containing protein [Planctomycetes bacterium]|nr:DUF1549 domain-containing protein [Planctomycetota bacterium]